MGIQESEALVDVAKKNAEALITEAKAEGNAAKQLKTVREWELQMAKLEVSEAMARKSKIVISGDVGDLLLEGHPWRHDPQNVMIRDHPTLTLTPSLRTPP